MSSIAEIVEADVDWLADFEPRLQAALMLISSEKVPLTSHIEMALRASADLPKFERSLTARRTVIFGPNTIIVGSAIGGQVVVGGNDDGKMRRPTPPKGPGLGMRVTNEVHDLLCSSDKYQDERANLLKEYKAGQSAIVASVAVFIAPHLQMGTEALAPAIAVAFTVIGQVGLRTWCGYQTTRRQRFDERHLEATKEYEADLKRWKKQARELDK